MNFKTMEQIAKHPDLPWMLSLSEASRRAGYSRQVMAEFLNAQSVPYYRVGKEKKYFLWEVLEAIEKTRWKESSVGT